MSALEELLAVHIAAAKLPEPVRELTFAPPRRFRFDFAWPSCRLSVEVDGGVWSGGRHARGGGITKDHEKMNLAVLDGWRVLRFTADHVKSGYALKTLEEAMRRFYV